MHHDTTTSQRARGATRGGGVDTPVNKGRCRDERHDKVMEVADAMATTEEDAAGLGTVAAGWEDEGDKTGIEDNVGQ